MAFVTLQKTLCTGWLRQQPEAQSLNKLRIDWLVSQVLEFSYPDDAMVPLHHDLNRGQQWLGTTIFFQPLIGTVCTYDFDIGGPETTISTGDHYAALGIGFQDGWMDLCEFHCWGRMEIAVTVNTHTKQIRYNIRTTTYQYTRGYSESRHQDSLSLTTINRPFQLLLYAERIVYRRLPDGQSLVVRE